MDTNTDRYPKVYLYKRIVQAKLFIDEYFADNIDLNNIADEAFFSKFHFIRLFKDTYSYTPHQYLTKVRINKAAEMLRAGHPVGDTCFAVGFESISSFTGLFKKHQKTNPSTYQRNHKTRQAAIKAAPLQFIPNCFAENKGWVK